MRETTAQLREGALIGGANLMLAVVIVGWFPHLFPLACVSGLIAYAILVTVWRNWKLNRTERRAA